MREIEKYLSTTEFKSRQQLQIETGLSDRHLRLAIADLKKRRPVIYDNRNKGYRLARPLNEMTQKEIAEERNAIARCIRDIEARKKALSSYENSYIAYYITVEAQLKAEYKESNHD